MRLILNVFAHKQLLGQFVLREIKGRFAGSFGGLLWALIHPAVSICVYIFLFSLVLRIRVTVQETGTDSFAIFFLTGMFPWLMFSEGLMRSVGCLVDNANLITKVVFPVELFPVSMVLSATIINSVGLFLFMGYLVKAGMFHYSWSVLAVLIPLQLIFTCGLAYLLSAACVFIRDVREVLGLVLMIWFYATPIIYPISMVPESIRIFLKFNPMAAFIDLYRQVFLFHRIDHKLLVLTCLFSLACYFIGAWFFKKSRPAFGDVL